MNIGKVKSVKINAGEIKDLLAHRHREDVFVQELSSFIENKSVRIDGWAMVRGSNLTIGYEVKVDKRDFNNDGKWHLYKRMCHELYFVCPWSMIQPDELPPDVGLIWVSKLGNKLYMKKKAVRHDTDIQMEYSLVKSILWNRCTIEKRVYRESPKEFWTAWLKERKVDRTFGRGLSKTLKRTIKDKITEVEKENQRLEYENSVLSSFKKKLYEFSGISPERTVEEAIRICQDKTIKQVDSAEVLEMRYLLSALNDVLSGNWMKTVNNYIQGGFQVNYHGTRMRVEPHSEELNPSFILQELDKKLSDYPKMAGNDPKMGENEVNITIKCQK